MRSVISFVITGLLGASAFAGVMNGGGGKGVVCRDSQNQIKSVELLDLWEARTLFGEQPMQVSGDIETEVKSALERLKYGYPFSGSGTSPDGTCEKEECTFRSMLEEIPPFLQPNPRVLRLHGVTLQLTDDSYEIARPVDCEIEQIVNYQDNDKIYINQDLWDRLDNLNKVALITHEAFYSFLRSWAGEENSIRTRRAIGYIMSGKSFMKTSIDFPQNDYVECNRTDYLKWTNIYLSWKAGNTPGSRGTSSIYPNSIFGASLIGLLKPVSQTSDVFIPNSFIKAFKDGTCHDLGFRWVMRFDGPVEFDHQALITYNCEQGVPKVYISEQRAGMPETNELPLTCKYIGTKKK